ncbi:MAG: HNH endonuclease [Chloroflexi bacterium]|nr:HNH endonuclease [Chloroflexota bacterium]
MPLKLPNKKIQQQLASITNKRARIVIEHILKRGFVTTEELEKKSGYNHPPRAARDVREAGIPLETFRVRSSDGRSIAGYRFGDLTKIRKERLQGRKTFPKKLKEEMYETGSHKCAICGGEFESRYLQIDHRVPYEVAGDDKPGIWNPQDLMLVCGSCNRAKSWSCEHCENWKTGKAADVCLNCYWASPERYLHVALQEIRRTDILWRGNEVQTYERLKQAAQANQSPIPEYVKRIIAKHIE